MSTRKDKATSEAEGGEEIPVTFGESTGVDMDAATHDAGDNEADTTAEEVGPEEELSEETLSEETNSAAADATSDEDPLTAAQQEAADYYDRLLRLSAEFENYKKRSSRELSDFRKFANEQIIKDLLGVIDNLERALASAVDQEGSSSSIAEGVELTLKEIFKILERNSVTVIAAEGETFDPTYHQAVMQHESADHPPNTVVQELQKGYLLHNRLLRPSMVAVSKSDSGS